MPRGLLLSPNDTPLSEDELSFYLPKLISTYVALEKRRRQRLALAATFWLSACAIAYTSLPDAVVAVPLIGAKLTASIATAALYAMGMVLAQMSVFDRSAASAFRQEVEVLHTLRYGTEAPIWYLWPPTITDTLQLLQPKISARFLFFLFLAVASTMLAALMCHLANNWAQMPIVARILTVFGTVVLLNTFLLRWLARNYGIELYEQFHSASSGN